MSTPSPLDAAFKLPEGSGCNSWDCKAAAAPTSSQSLSSSTYILEGEALSCNSSQAGRESRDSSKGYRLTSKPALLTGLQRSVSCCATEAEASADLPRLSGSTARHQRRNSADSLGSWKKHGKGMQSPEQKRKWRPTQTGPLKKLDFPLPGFLNEPYHGTWDTNSASSGMARELECKLEEMPLDRKLGPLKAGLERSKSLKSPLVRKNSAGRVRTSRYIGVGSSNRKNQWQARILVHGKVTHLGYHQSEEEAAMAYDKVAVALNGTSAQTNFPRAQYLQAGCAEFAGLSREDLQRALGVKPMDKSSRFRGVSRKKGKWEAKVMVNRKWAYRALFDSEDEAAKAYDAAVWRLKPREASSFVNFNTQPAARKRPPRTALPPARSKSQKLATPQESTVLPKSQSLSEILTLEDNHITPCDMEAPATPKRPHSVQLPLSPLSCQTLGQSASNLMMPELATNFTAETSLPIEGTSNLMKQLSGSSQPSVYSSFAQLPVTISNPTHLNLPDPNSIGVPPPDNLPFPGKPAKKGQRLVFGLSPSAPSPHLRYLSADLVKTPFSTAPPPDAMLQSPRTSNLVGLTSRDSGMPCLSMTSSRRSSVTAACGLPEIPRPLLQPASLSHENMGMGMDSYFASTPLSQELGNTLAHNNQAHRQEVQHPPSPTRNPFQEASNMLPPISASPSSSLVRANSEAFTAVPPPSSCTVLNKLSSVSEAELRAMTQPFMQPVRLPPAGSVPLLRATSESLHRCQMPPDMSLQPNAPFSALSSQVPSLGSPDDSRVDNAGLAHQLSISGRNTEIAALMLAGNPARTSSSAGHELALSKAFFDGQVSAMAGNNLQQGFPSNFSCAHPQFNPLGTQHCSAKGDLSYLPNVPMQSGQSIQCLSTESMLQSQSPLQGAPGLQFHPDTNSSHQTRRLQPGPALALNAGGICAMDTGNEPNIENATDILDSLLQDSDKANQHGGLQIGGDFLNAYDPIGMAADEYLGRT